MLQEAELFWVMWHYQVLKGQIQKNNDMGVCQQQILASWLVVVSSKWTSPGSTYDGG